MRIRIAVLPFLALGTAAAPCAAQGDGNEVPRELVQALLLPVAERGRPDPAIVVGRLPGEIPAGLVPPEATVVGGASDRSGGSALLTVAQAPAEAIAGWRAQLERAGWHPHDDPSQQPSPGTPAFVLCGPDRTLLGGWATPSPRGGSELQVRVVRADLPYSPCSGARRPTVGDVPFPELRAPGGGQRMGGGGGGSPDHHNDYGRFRTTRSPGEVAADFVAQLRQAGWRASDPRAGAGGATAWAELRDARGKDWRALVAVLPVAEGEHAFAVRVVGATTEPLHPEDWVPVAHDAGPPVPGELVRALLAQPTGNGYEERPTLVSGRLPQELAGTPLPSGARVVGGAVYPDKVQGVAFVPGEPPLTLTAYAQVLRQAGWLQERQRALVSRGATDESPYFCDPNGRFVFVSIIPVRDGGSYLKLDSFGAAGSCTPESRAALNEIPLPLLSAPEGAELRGGTGGYGSSQFDWEVHGRLETALSPAAVVQHYAGLLRQAGWTVAPPAAGEGTATATGELRDARGITWHALIASAALSPTERDVLVRVVRPQDR